LLPLVVGRNGDKTPGEEEEEEERNKDEAGVLGSKTTTRKVTNARQAATAQAALPPRPCPCKHGMVALMAGYLRSASMPRKGCFATMAR
jgi:hypothetical protein